jgi:Zn ribbon nucleic-acid-binding protein
MGKRKCPGCEAKDQTIIVLSDQIDWLRAQLGTPWFRPQPNQLKSTPEDSFEAELFRAESPMEMMHMGEDEIEIRELQADGHLTASEAEEALRRIGAANTTVTIS